MGVIYLTKPQVSVCTFISPFNHPLASVTYIEKKKRMICPETRSTVQTQHILYTSGHKVGLFLWFPKISCSKILLSLHPKLRAVFTGCIKENILPCKCSDLLIMWASILKWDCFGQTFKELQNKYSEKPVFQKCACVDLHLWLIRVVRNEWCPHICLHFIVLTPITYQNESIQCTLNLV